MSEYHDGEIKVQELADARFAAEQLAGSVFPFVPPAAGRYVMEQRFAAITWRDGQGRLWITPFSGEPGIFFAADEHTIVCDLRSGRAPYLSAQSFNSVPIALIIVNFNLRRRMRINGIAVTGGESDPDGNHEWLIVRAMELYSNCPKYIQRREPILEEHSDKTMHSEWADGNFESSLNKDARRLINSADTFFIGTFAEQTGADASHRGGKKGFVEADDRTIRWHDFPGNNMFNTLGNIQINKEAALLFFDFTTRDALIVSGRIESFEPSSHGKVATHEIVLRVESSKILSDALSTSWAFVEASPYNP